MGMDKLGGGDGEYDFFFLVAPHLELLMVFKFGGWKPEEGGCCHT